MNLRERLAREIASLLKINWEKEEPESESFEIRDNIFGKLEYKLTKDNIIVYNVELERWMCTTISLYKLIDERMSFLNGKAKCNY